MLKASDPIPAIDDSPVTAEKLSMMRRRLEEQESDMPGKETARFDDLRRAV